MAASRYWRSVGVEAQGGGDLELSAIALYAGGARVDGTATLTCSHAPTEGALANLQDTDGATTARFDGAAVRSGGFYLQWDFGTPVDVDEIKLGGAGLARFMTGATLMQTDTLSNWTYTSAFAGATYPGDGALTTSRAGGFTPTTWNPLDKGPGCTLSNGDLTAVGNAFDGWTRSVFGATSGKWYWELISTGLRFPFVAVAQFTSNIGSGMAETTGNWAFYGPAPYKGHNRAYLAYGTKWTAASQIVGFALDMEAGTLELFMNGVSMGLMYSGITGTVHAAVTGDTNGTTSNTTANFGATAFSYAQPPGFNAGFGIASLRLPLAVARPRTAGSPLMTAAASAVPDFSTCSVGRIATARDIEFGGIGTVYGTVKEKRTPANAPLYRRVLLIDERSRITIRETWSDPVTGDFEFSGVRSDVKYTVISYDHLDNYRAVLANGLGAEVAA